MTTRHTVEMGGQTISWLQSGRGRTLILLHGFPLHAGMWEALHETTPHGWTLITPDLRNFGESKGTPALSIDDHADDVLALLRHLGCEDAVIGGLSMGGYIAFAVLRHAARYVHALVLADTKPQADSPEALEGRQRLLQTLEAKGPAGVADEMIPKLLGETTRRERPEVVARVRELILANPSGAIAGAIRALMSRPDSTALLPAVHVPTLILVGVEDTVTPVANALEMQKAIAGAELVQIPGAGHLSNLEQPEVFDAALARFLSHRV